MANIITTLYQQWCLKIRINVKTSIELNEKRISPFRSLQIVVCKCPSTVIKLFFIDLYSFISNLQFFDGALRYRKNVITPLKNLVNGFLLRTWHSVIIWFGLFNQYCQKFQHCHLPSIKIFDTVDYSLNWNWSKTFSLIYY